MAPSATNLCARPLTLNRDSFGASRGNRTLISWLEARNNNHYTTDALFLEHLVGIEPTSSRWQREIITNILQMQVYFLIYSTVI